MLSDDNIRIDYIIRSLDFGRRFGRLEGLFPIKHIGIMITNGQQVEVYHVQNRSKLVLVGHIEVDLPCRLDEFASGMDVKSVANRAIKLNELSTLLNWIYSFRGKPYILALFDCERVASIAYRKGITRFLFHRQVWVMFALSVLISSTYKTCLFLKENHYRLSVADFFIYCLGIGIAVIFLLYFVFMLNNTSYKRLNRQWKTN